MPKCAVCKKQFEKTYSTLQKVCSIKCAIDHAKAKKLTRIYRPHHSRRLNKTNKQAATDLKARKKAAKTACHNYIRERDKHKPCICCGEPLKPNFQAGHWINDGQNPKTRYDEDNIHGQNLNCNYYKNGDSGNYRVNLINRIGTKRVERLESMKGGTLKRTADDYREIEKYYKDKLAALQNR